MIRPEDIEAAWPGAGEIVGIVYAGANGERRYSVGDGTVTRIEKTVKAGEQSFIPYVRVWVGDAVLSEHCQHRLTGVWFKVRA